MTARKVRVAHCYRCIYSWRMRRRYPKICPRCKSRLWRVPKLVPATLGRGLGIEEILAPHRPEILRLCREHGALNVRVFGSVRRREAGPESDVDLLVDWSKGSQRLHLELELSALLGRTVDVISADRLRWYALPNVLAEAVEL